ncbi:MAG: L-2-amino-thiazoline-4-carboxylic acid hydrolase [Euryarchaeota archaeon]|nr:L-2-amino-thiazoline-4-carboxylic acid hydrolase [Euryarchaeota archaeon]MBV1730509.1 L-2-amino-thiazoline-4-carboxylic acid hydrolase [Methanobacterium sp.]MBU4547212.1 L-2-amino-thiazoline-4-carboxylic acid hydrolase [Euryarchaeota archaeon]MBU4606978.1 L-2-amino-thiazoline-4-carboxylic acid hydrolase [Euryarchaeota archaeon]MBV1754806.1 L-2-amino-thiazoline-4-carboxylic acid hydrolase [Methanobacterium sp.]
MNLKLLLASWWIPEYLLKKELNNLASLTINELDNILKSHDPDSLKNITPLSLPLKGNLSHIRLKMIQGHESRVQALENLLGRERSIDLARPAMFKVGYRLGLEFKKKLNIKDDTKEIMIAAHILYKVLGIEFEFQDMEDDPHIIISHCELASYYSPLSCQILSGADEGVLRGLNPAFDMKFIERITEGASCCKARLKIKNYSETES